MFPWTPIAEPVSGCVKRVLKAFFIHVSYGSYRVWTVLAMFHFSVNELLEHTGYPYMIGCDPPDLLRRQTEP